MRLTSNTQTYVLALPIPTATDLNNAQTYPSNEVLGVFFPFFLTCL